MASLLDWGKKKASAAYHGINPLDNGQGWTSVAPPQLPNQRSIASRVFDQLNPIDSGRTFKQAAPQNTRTGIQQLTHNAITNTIGNIGYKPVTSLAPAFIIEPGRSVVADITGNQAAELAAEQRKYQALDRTLPGFFANQAFNVGSLPVNLTRQSIADFTNNPVASRNANTAVMQNINATPIGQVTNILQRNLADYQARRDNPNLTKDEQKAIAKVSLQEVGIDPNASLGKQLGETGLGIAQLVPLLKGGGKTPRTPTQTPLTPKQQAMSNLSDAQLMERNYIEMLQAQSRPGSAVVGEGAKLPTALSAQAKADLMANARAKVAAKPAIPAAQPQVLTPTVPKVIEGLAPKSPFTSTPKSPNAFQRSWQTVNGVISQHGTGGKEISRRLIEQRNKSEISQQAFIDSIPAVTKLKGKDFTTFVQSLDELSKGKKINVAPNIQKAIGEWNQAIPQVRQRAVAAGLDVGDLGPNYFPRQYKNLFNNDNAMANIAEQMVKDGKAKDLGDAMGKLQFMKNEYQKPFGNLEKTRQFDLPGYEMTPEAMTNYVNRSFERITKAEQFGAKNEVLNQLRARMQEEGFNAVPGSTVDKYIKIALGDVDKSTAGYKVSGGIRKFNALRSLSTAGVSNATQLPVNTGTIAGVGRTLKGAVKTLVSPKARAEARQSGVVLDSVIDNLSKQGLGTGGAITRNIASPFFRQIEKFNRQATAVVGSDWGNSLAKKAAKGDAKATRILRDKLGVTGEIGSKLTRAQEIQASRSLVQRAQFKVDPMDLPGWVDSPMGKLAAQFRTFGYKQTGFMYNEVLREAMKGNFMPLTRFVTVGVPAGAAAQYVKSSIKGVKYTEDDESNVSQASKALMAIGGLGLPGSEAQNLYKSAQYDNLEGGLAGVAGGPTASLLTETAVNLNKAIKGDSTKLQKQGLRNIPMVGPSIANRVFPKKDQPAAPGTPKNKEALLNKNSPEAKEATKVEKEQLELTPDAVGIRQLSNGDYAYTEDGIVRYTSKLETARTAIAKEEFSKEEGSYKIIGDKVYRKNPDGTIGDTISKTAFDYRIGTATLTAQKRAGDIEGWMKTAQGQLESIDKQLQDPNIDPLEAITLQNQAEALLYNMEKYQDYGGFTKYGSSGGGGRTARGGGSRGGRGGTATALTGSFKTASSLKAPSPPKISVRKLAAPKARALRKLSVSKIPSSYTSRRLG